jgi:threonine synthase
VLEIDGNFDLALELTKQIAEEFPITLVNSVNPFRIDGQKTGAFEVVERLERAPDLHFMPVGNAGNITAYWRGYGEARSLGWTASLPQMFGWQAEGADPIVRGEVVAEPETVATAIRIGNPASWSTALDAASMSGGAIRSVSDEEIVRAYESLAGEGIFVELASAAGVAGLRKMNLAGEVPKGATIVCVLTGHGLKDPDWVMAATPRPKLVAADVKEILENLNLN